MVGAALATVLTASPALATPASRTTPPTLPPTVTLPPGITIPETTTSSPAVRPTRPSTLPTATTGTTTTLEPPATPSRVVEPMPVGPTAISEPAAANVSANAGTTAPEQVTAEAQVAQPQPALTSAAAGRTWLGPTPVAKLPKGNVELWAVPAGPTGLVLMTYVSATHSYQYQRRNLAGGWTPIRTVATDATGPLFDSAAVAADTTTARFVLPIGTNNEMLRYQVDDGSAITQSIVLGPGSTPAITIGLDGTAVVAARTATGISIWRITPGGSVTGPTQIAADTATAQAVDPRLATGPQGAVLLVWANAQASGRIASWSQLTGSNWSSPALIDTGGAISTLSGFAANQTQAILTWIAWGSSNDTVASTFKGGAWGPAEVIGSGTGSATVAVSVAGETTISTFSASFTRVAGSSSWQRQDPIPHVPLYCSKGDNPIAYAVHDLHGFLVEAKDGACNVQEYELGSGGGVPAPVPAAPTDLCAALQGVQAILGTLSFFVWSGFLPALMRLTGCAGV